MMGLQSRWAWSCALVSLCGAGACAPDPGFEEPAGTASTTDDGAGESTSEPTTGAGSSSTTGAGSTGGDLTGSSTGAPGTSGAGSTSSTTGGGDPVCGDGNIDPSEECDDGNANANDGACLPDCTAATCGDALVHQGREACDDGNTDNNDACTELCAPPECGDGFAQTVNGELCDDGDEVQGDECNDDCSGSGLWTDTFNGVADSNDEVRGVAFDGTGNVVSVGSVFDVQDNDDVWVRKYDPAGNELWTRTHHGLTSDLGYGVAVADDDDIVVVGSVFTQSQGRDIWLRRYTSGGGTVFTESVDGPGSDADEGLAVALDPSGNVVVAGYVTSNATGRDIWVGKYTAAGSQIWTRNHSSNGDNDDEGRGVATDAQGNVIVAGSVATGGGGRDVWVRKYDSDGATSWTRTHDGPASGIDESNAVATDSSGDIVVVGQEDTANQGLDVWIRKLDADGNELWTQTYNAPQDDDDVGRAAAIDSQDNVLVAGSIWRGVQANNVWVRKFDADGNELWTSVYNSDAFQADVANAVAADANGNVAVGGYELRSDLDEARNAWTRYIIQ